MTKKTSRKSSSSLAEKPASPFDSLLKSLDLVAANLEAKYGAGILTSLCTPDTAAKFTRVSQSLDDAIKSQDYDTIKAKVESLKRGWLKMEEEAIASGYLKTVEAWYVCAPESGIQYIIAKHEADTAILAAQYPAKTSIIYSLAAIAQLIESQAVVNLTMKESAYFREKAKERADEAQKVKSCSEILADAIPF
jgi:hypothetical protein